MNICTIYTKQVLISVFLVICFQNEIFSQGTNNIGTTKPGLFFGFTAGPTQSQITNKQILLRSGFSSKNLNGYSGAAEIGYFISEYFGLSSGIGFISYKSQLNLDTYQSQYNTTDSENETYQRQVEGKNIKELQEIGSLNVPINLNFRLPFSKKFGFFLQTGVNLAIPLSKNYTSSGTFTFKGYYPAYNVLLEDLPAYGFPTNLPGASKGELELKPYSINASGFVGFDLFIKKNIQIALAAFYTQSLSNISAYSSQDKFQLSTDVNMISSLMGASSNVSVQSMGVMISLRYYLKAL